MNFCNGTCLVIALSFFVCIFVFNQLYLVEDDAYKVVVDRRKKLNIHDGKNCTFSTCLRTEKCLLDANNLRVYVQPIVTVLDQDGNQLNPAPSTQFLDIRGIIKNSRHFTSNPASACLIVPGIDFLSTDRLSSTDDVPYLLSAASELFDFEPNLLIFQFFGGVVETNTVIASSRHLQSTFRRYFDASIPALDVEFIQSFGRMPVAAKQRVLAVDLDMNLERNRMKEKLTKAFGDEFGIVSKCLNKSLCVDRKPGEDLSSLKGSDFLILTEDLLGFEHVLGYSLKNGFIPVIISDLILLPFEDVIDWTDIAFVLSPVDFEVASKRILGMGGDDVLAMKHRGKQAYDRHFASLTKIIGSTLAVLEHKLITTVVKSGDQGIGSGKDVSPSTFLPRCDYFVAVVLHRSGTSLNKLQWMLRFFLYTETKASMVLVFTETNLDNVFDDFIIPTRTLPIRVIPVNFADIFGDYISNYESECLLFVIDSNYQSSLLDEDMIDDGFDQASNLPHMVTFLTDRGTVNGSRCLKSTCPYFVHTKHSQGSGDSGECVSLIEKDPKEGKRGNKAENWISCFVGVD